MFTNPFYDLPGFVTPALLQTYVIAMFLAVIAGTIFDVIHKKSAQYFFENAKKAEKAATRTVTSSEKTSLALSTLANEVLTSSEFANPKRRMSHLLTMYGFILFVASTAIMIFGYPSHADPAPGFWVAMWHLGALMICGGGYWFWFSIRCDVNSEGNPWYRLVRADLFVLSLLMSATFALVWSVIRDVDFISRIAFGIYIMASTVLFTTVIWSKFAHMFFKPAAAYQKKVTKADGSQENLPDLGDLASAELQDKFPDIPTYMGKTPPNMGLGIKRESPNHY